MIHQKIQLKTKKADGYVIPLGALNLVCIITDTGMVGCGAFDIAALDKYGYPCARIKSTSGIPITTIEDLLSNTVVDINDAAARSGITAGLSGREALDLL